MSAEVDRRELAAEIATAIRRRQFTLWYQPLINLADDRLVGVEALARWRHPRHGVLGPDTFIGLAEETGTIVALGTLLLRRACRDAAAWNRAGRPGVYVSVNLAGAQIWDPQLCRIVEDALDDSGLPPQLLQLEVTETAPAYRHPVAAANIRTLIASGIRVAIDDFGTGYSNLEAVRLLRCTDLKIARSLVQSAQSPLASAQPDRMLEFAADVAKGCGMSITAEGIETEADMRRVRELGCQTGQGWLFGRPVPAKSIARRLAAA